MIELGALIGAASQSWVADKFSRKFMILHAVFIFSIGSIMHSSSQGYAMLVVARLIGGMGIGQLSMVAHIHDQPVCVTGAIPIL
jgi:predicted MFS family arabinose efflux permease